MSERIESMIRKYPEMKRERDCLRHQIDDFYGVTAEDVIMSMNGSHPEGEHVQTSGASDKTAMIGMNYREKMERINEEWYEHLVNRYMKLDEEIRFFESALKSLNGVLADMMWDLIINEETWDFLGVEYNVCRSTIANYRRKAIRELDKLYEKNEKDRLQFMLS